VATGLEAILALEELASPIKAFIADECAIGGEVKIDELYRAWVGVRKSDVVRLAPKQIHDSTAADQRRSRRRA